MEESPQAVPEDDTVVVRSYGDILAYENPYGDIVIKQEKPYEEDHFVGLPRVSGAVFLAKIRELLGEN